MSRPIPYNRAAHLAVRHELAIALNNLAAGPQRGPAFEAAHDRVVQAELAIYLIIRDVEAFKDAWFAARLGDAPCL